MDISIEQKDFRTFKDKYAMSITEEKIDTIDFASGAAEKQTIKMAKLPPAIRILSPKNGDVIEEELVYLAGMVTDYRKIENVSVKVNGLNIPLNLEGLKRKDISAHIPLSE